MRFCSPLPGVNDLDRMTQSAFAKCFYMKELVVEAKVESLTKVIDFINAELEHHTCSSESLGIITLAI